MKALTLHPDAYLVAVDASLGTLYVGVFRREWAYKTGAGLKELPAVGDMHITGVVNTGGLWIFLSCKHPAVCGMKMADIIARGLHMAFSEYSSVNFQDTYNVL